MVFLFRFFKYIIENDGFFMIFLVVFFWLEFLLFNGILVRKMILLGLRIGLKKFFVG